MKPSFAYLQEQLKAKNMKLSHQRLKVLQYLMENQCHPTVDQIFTSLQKDIPTLSKTTVYNTLRTLAEAGLVRVITIEDHETRYDILTETHGHFKCSSCGTIYDFHVDAGALTSEDLDHFRIQHKNVYFKGVCAKCLSNEKK